MLKKQPALEAYTTTKVKEAETKLIPHSYIKERGKVMGVFDASVWHKPVMIRLEGGEANYNWHRSAEYKKLEDVAQALSPNKRIWDRRTKAYKYMKWHEPRVRNKWESTQTIKERE